MLFGVYSTCVTDCGRVIALPALQRCILSVFSECCFLELLVRPSSVRTLFLIGFVVLFSRALFLSHLRVAFVGLLSSLTGTF